MAIFIFLIGFILGAVASGLIVAVGALSRCDNRKDWWDEEDD